MPQKNWGWIEAFTIVSLVITSYYPYLWKDLMAYKVKLLTTRTYRQFQGWVWLSHDQAFREHRAATKLMDWSSMNVQLYNYFHDEGVSIHGPSNAAGPLFSPEPSGSAASQIICKSWNEGRCVAPSSQCRFSHCCGDCAAGHCLVDCPINPLASKAHSRSSSGSPKNPKCKRCWTLDSFPVVYNSLLQL